MLFCVVLIAVYVFIFGVVVCLIVLDCSFASGRFGCGCGGLP